LRHILLDTHIWAWSLTARHRLSTRLLTTFDEAETISISAITLYEVGQKARLGKWPEMEPLVSGLVDLATRQGARLVNISPDICVAAAALDWVHRDPFDRLIAATAMTEKLTLLSVDSAFDQLASRPNWPGRVW
jgi:PIN domain nuclease of toxin-antitoxin system